jgi:hypothetical protein
MPWGANHDEFAPLLRGWSGRALDVRLIPFAYGYSGGLSGLILRMVADLPHFAGLSRLSRRLRNLLPTIVHVQTSGMQDR